MDIVDDNNADVVHNPQEELLRSQVLEEIPFSADDLQQFNSLAHSISVEHSEVPPALDTAPNSYQQNNMHNYQNGNSNNADRVYLSVPFAEKDQAKALGARWDSGARKWYVNSSMNLEQFSRWM